LRTWSCLKLALLTSLVNTLPSGVVADSSVCFFLAFVDKMSWITLPGGAGAAGVVKTFITTVGTRSTSGCCCAVTFVSFSLVRSGVRCSTCCSWLHEPRGASCDVRLVCQRSLLPISLVECWLRRSQDHVLCLFRNLVQRGLVLHFFLCQLSLTDGDAGSPSSWSAS
jgi:hypothetical protein